jgi:hypothetical protein
MKMFLLCAFLIVAGVATAAERVVLFEEYTSVS